MGNRMCLKKRKKMMWEGQTLTPALSLRERGKGGFVLRLSSSPRPSPSGRGRKASPCSICPLSHRERVRVRGIND